MRNPIILPVLAAMMVASNGMARDSIDPVERNVISSVKDIGVLPHEKEELIKGFVLKQPERNPFADRAKGEKGLPSGDSQSEDSRIRLALESFSVSGIAKGQGGYKAQLGSIILSEGKLIPRLIPGQSDDLRVTKITPELVEITWVADEEAAKPRKITLEIDLDPRVGVLLPTVTNGGSGGVKKLVYASMKEADSE
ncbi:MAG: hypothetical protein GY899_14060 [Verrucomicrobiaceae bacterium]|nr:hypothetical protein [Verrucomicrobiaceae bacterium]